MPEIEARPTFMVHQLNAELARICNPLFKKLGVDIITSRLLVIIREKPGVLVGDVQRIMALPQSTVSHQIKRLEQAGLVIRSADAQDKRAFSVHLTPRGEDVAFACDQISEEIYAELFDDIDDGALQTLVESLNFMGQRLSRVSASDFQDKVEERRG